MNTVAFRTVLWGVARRLGLKPNENLSPDQAETITDYINTELATAWLEFPWPQLVLCEQRWFRPVWEVAAYDAGDEVFHEDTGAYWRAVADVLGVDVPGVSPDWVQITELDRYVAYAQPGMSPIGEVLGAWDRNPRVHSAAQLVPYWLSDAGVQFAAEAAPVMVWLEFRRRVSEFTAELYEANRTYLAGERVYFPDNGECYLAIDASEDADPPHSAEVWQHVPMPAFLSRYVTEAATALALDEDGQSDKARKRRTEAELLLTRAMQQYSAQGQVARYRVN